MRWPLQPLNKLARVAAAVLLIALMGAPAVIAQNSAAISQGFSTTEKEVLGGSIVSLQEGKNSTVRLANTDRVDEMVGVAADEPLVELGDAGKTVQVVTSGMTKAFVSNINGDVKAGDKITASPINGVGMKATSSSLIVGTAQVDLVSANLTARTVKDKSGGTQTVQIGTIPIQINISYYALDEQQRTVIPLFLQQVANSVAGKDVSVARVAVGTLVLLMGFASVGVLLYASIRSSIISIGRNPLSEKAVHKSLLGVGVISISILLVMLFTIYLILTV